MTWSVAHVQSSLALFAATSASYTIFACRRKIKHGAYIWNSIRKVTTTRNSDQQQRSSQQFDYENIYHLRKKNFSSSLSVSYLNSGPLMILRGEGAHLMDHNGISYLDTRNNVAHVGHCHPVVVKAVQDQIAQLNTNTRYLHPTMCLLAERLLQLFPAPLEVVFFVNSGSEANDLALRLARAKTRCKNTIVVDHAYHGHTLGTLDVSPYKYETSNEFVVAAEGEEEACRRPPVHVKKVPCPDMYRGLYRESASIAATSNDDDEETAAAKYYSSFVKEACDGFGGKGRVSAFMMESGMSVAGVILPPVGYLHRVVSHVRSCGGLYIADEVQTGFGRFGSCMWGFQHNNDSNTTVDGINCVVPDIVTVGKPFGNGMPLAAVVTTRDVADAFDTMNVEYFNTFGGNPVCAAAGLAVLNVLEREQLQRNAQVVGSYLMRRLKMLRNTIDLIGDVRGSGLFIGIELVKGQTSKEPAVQEASYLCTALKTKYHILSSLDGPYSNVFVLKPPLVFSMEDADYFIECFERAILDDLPMMDLSNVSHTPT